MSTDADRSCVNKTGQVDLLPTSELLATLAEGTGGKWYHDNNDLRTGFKLLAAAPEFVYTLAYTPSVLKSDGKYHALKVALKNPKGLALQARRGYFAPKREVDLAAHADQDIHDAVFSREDVLDLPIELHTQFFKSNSEDAKLSVITRIHAKLLKFRKDGDRNTNTVTLVSAVFDTDGNLVQALKKVIELKVKDETLEKRLDRGLTVRTSFDVKIGNYLVRLVARDSEGQMMAAANSLVEIR